MSVRTAIAAVVLLMFADAAGAADAVVDRSAEAVKGRAVVDAHCRKCHSGAWEGETYESILALLMGMDTGKVTHRFKIKKLSAVEAAQVAAYWTPTQR